MTGTRFLVVDESQTIRRIVANTLRASGYGEVTEAADGNDAKTKLLTEGADMLITDWNVPLMDGLELVRWVRREPGCAGVTILLMTTRGNRDDVLEAKEAGVDQYIVKPFTVRELKKKIGSMLKSREPRPA